MLIIFIFTRHIQQVMKRKKGKMINVSSRKSDKTYKGFVYKSRLERDMAMILDSAGLPINYETKTFELQEPFKRTIESYKRTQSGKGEFKNRGIKNSDIHYTPDFVDNIDSLGSDGSFIIECKGHATPLFNLRYKMFEKYCDENLKGVTLYMPRDKVDCLKTVELILKKRK